MHRPEIVLVAPAVVPVHTPVPAPMPTTSTVAARERGGGPPPPVEVLELLPLEGESTPPGISMLSVQEALVQCMNMNSSGGGGALGVNEVEIRPVEVGNPHNHDCLSLMNLPIASHLSRSQAPPQFSNKKEDWHAFIRKFDTWSRLISGGRVLNDQESLQLLLSCLPECLKREMQLWEHEKNRTLKYIELRAYLEAKFSRAQSENMRKKWLEIQIPKTGGKITAQHFDEFRVNFKLAMADVLDVTPEEARRVLREKLPPFMCRWVVEGEAKKMKNRPLVEMVMDNGLDTMAVQTAVCRWVGTPPLKVESKGGGVYLVHFGDERIAKRLAEFHGRGIAGHEKKMQVRVVEQHFSVEEIFYEVMHQMETQERTAEFPRRTGGGDYQIRKADAQTEKKDKFKATAQNQPSGERGGRPPPPAAVIPPPIQLPMSLPPPSAMWPQGGGRSIPSVMWWQLRTKGPQHFPMSPGNPPR